MKAKALEIRDEMTFIAILAVDMNPEIPKPTDDIIAGTAATYTGQVQRFYLRRCGYPCDGRPNILISRLNGNGKASNDPYSWGGRTFPVAHSYIIDHWTELRDGDVIDVQYILGETFSPKTSERFR